MSTLYHYSDRGGIEVFVPRAPSGHPESEPLVFAIDAWHSPLYYFPRECPRTGVWPVLETTSEDSAEFARRFGSARMWLAIQRDSESEWRAGQLYRYAFAMDDSWIDAEDHGCWVSRVSKMPIEVARLADLPELCRNENCTVELVDDLAALTFELRKRSWHVSAIRHSLIPGYCGETGTPVAPPSLSR